MSHRDRALAQSDAELEAECEVTAARGSGPGGQKRNKTSTSVRISHPATGVALVCDETRSQARNRRVAVQRLRPRLALEVREAPEALGELASELEAPSPSSEGFWPAVAKVLDRLESESGALGASARALATTTAQLSRFLGRDERVFRAANELRSRHGRGPMRR